MCGVKKRAEREDGGRERRKEEEVRAEASEDAQRSAQYCIA